MGYTGLLGGTYYARVVPAAPGGNQATGVYVLGTDLGVHPPTMYDTLAAGSLSAAQAVSYANLAVGERALERI